MIRARFVPVIATLAPFACGGHASTAPPGGAETQASPKCAMQPLKLADKTILVPMSTFSYSFDDLAVANDHVIVALSVGYMQGGSPTAASASGSAPAPSMGGSLANVSYIGRIVDVPLHAGSPKVLADNVPGGTSGLCSTSTRVVYGSSGDVANGSHDGSILSIPFEGGSSTTLVSSLSTAWTSGISTDGNTIYWADGDGVHGVSVAGGAARTITNRSVDMVIPLGNSLLLDDDTGGNVLSIGVDGGPTATLATNQVNPIDAQNCGGGDICWADEGALSGPGSRSAQGAAIMKRDPSGRLTLLASPGVRSQLRFDGNDLFVNSGDCCGGGIVRLSPDGGSATTVVTTGGAGPYAVDDQCVYWTTNDGLFTINKGASTEQPNSASTEPVMLSDGGE